MLEVRPTALDGVLEIFPRRFGDDRGFFSETWSKRSLAEAGLDHEFVQDNHSMSAARGVLRGLHFQLPPAAQVKLVRVSRGKIFDVAVDIRSGSSTFGQWVGVKLSAAAWNQLLIPHGFAHGFVTLEEHCEVQYKVTSPYAPESERSVRWDDPDLGIDWPIVEDLTLSDKDRAAPLLRDLETGF
jgi:dTDP-4-dehydrorhamnose 3,5-epimerase